MGQANAGYREEFLLSSESLQGEYTKAVALWFLLRTLLWGCAHDFLSSCGRQEGPGSIL